MEHDELIGITKSNSNKRQYSEPEIILLSALYTESKQLRTRNEFDGPITMFMYGPS